MAVYGVHLSPDGKRLAAFCVGNLFLDKVGSMLRVWDVETGRVLVQRPFRIDAHSRRSPNGRTLGTCRAHSRFTPDGKAVTVRADNELAIEDTLSGQTLTTIPGNLGLPLAIAPHGRLVAASEYKPFDDPFNGYQVQAVVLAEAATGKEVLRLETGAIGYLDFSADGRYLTTADNAAIRIWDVATGRQLFRRPWPKEVFQKDTAWHTAIAFALVPSNAAMVTGELDGTLLVWDLATQTWRTPAATKELGREQLDRFWSDLGGEDAAQAYRAGGALAAAPGSSPAFLKEVLQPAAPVDEQRIEALIADLDGNQFGRREAAKKELTRLRDEVEPILQRTLSQSPTLETRRRIEAILSAPAPAPTAEVLRGVRAVSVLEQIGTAAAQDLLRKVAAGAAGARLTREAQAALDRLARR
jgi:hypothetical protein